MTYLKWDSFTGQSLSPLYLHKVDLIFAQLLVYNQSLTTASESRLFGSVVKALILYRDDPSLIPGNFQLALLCYGYHVVKEHKVNISANILGMIIEELSL